MTAIPNLQGFLNSAMLLNKLSCERQNGFSLSFKLSLSSSVLRLPWSCFSGFLLDGWRPALSICLCMHEATYHQRCLMGGDKREAVNCLLSITPTTPYRPQHGLKNDSWNKIANKISKTKKKTYIALVYYRALASQL